MSKSLKKLIDINRLREFKNKLVGTDSAYVQTTAVDQTIAGTKTFSKPIVGSVTGSSGSCTGSAASANIATKATQDAAGNTITTTYATKAENNTKANNSEVVHKSGDETIAGTKTFSNGVLSTAVNAFMAQNKGYTVLLRNDGSATYLLISDKDGVPGTWSDAKPLTISNSTGVCSINGNAATATTATTAKACTGNAATATKLATARSLWGNNFDGSAAITGTITGTPGIEFMPPANTSNFGGVLDFHYNQSTADYTSRIIESASGTLSINYVTITTGRVVTAKTFNGALKGNVTGNCSGSSGSCTGNAASATKATQDSAGQQINTTYIKDLAVSGRTITYTKGDGSTGTITTGASLLPIGSYIQFAGSQAPEGFLVCNGGAISRTTYSALFAVIGTTYGSGDGSTTFNLPNLTNRFLQGSTTSGTVKNAGLPNITGFFNYNCTGVAKDVSFTGAINCSSGDINTKTPGDGAYPLYVNTCDFNASRSNSIYGNSSTVQPPALTCLICIKY